MPVLSTVFTRPDQPNYPPVAEQMVSRLAKVHYFCWNTFAFSVRAEFDFRLDWWRQAGETGQAYNLAIFKNYICYHLKLYKDADSFAKVSRDFSLSHISSHEVQWQQRYSELTTSSDLNVFQNKEILTVRIDTGKNNISQLRLLI